MKINPYKKFTWFSIIRLEKHIHFFEEIESCKFCRKSLCIIEPLNNFLFHCKKKRFSLSVNA
jgi:hypothetical protein